MQITVTTVEHIAKLARLFLTDDEKKTFASQMDGILGYAEKLKEIDTEGVIPTSHAVPMENSFRDDIVTPSLGIEKALANAPQSGGSFFRVPKVIE